MTIIKERNNLKLKNKELIHIEFLRIIAIYLVLFNHTKENGFFLFSIAEESSLYWVYMFVSIFDKIAVPIFFMISGALLLGKEESIVDIYKKRVIKFVVILLVISFCYHVYNWCFNETNFSIRKFLIEVYSKNASIGLWYLYNYIGMLIMLPFLRRLARTMTDKEYFYLILLQIIIVGVIPIAQYFFSSGTVFLNKNFSASIITVSNIFYVLIGYYVENKLDKKYFKQKNVYIGFAISFFAIFISCLMTHYRVAITGECNETVSQAFHNSLIAIPTITIYFSSKYFFENVNLNPRIIKVIQLVGGTTFGIYLMEGMLRERTMFIFQYLKPIIHTLPACIIWIGFACFLGSIITAILKRVPIIRKYL